MANKTIAIPVNTGILNFTKWRTLFLGVTPTLFLYHEGMLHVLSSWAQRFLLGLGALVLLAALVWSFIPPANASDLPISLFFAALFGTLPCWTLALLVFTRGPWRWLGFLPLGLLGLALML